MRQLWEMEILHFWVSNWTKTQAIWPALMDKYKLSSSLNLILTNHTTKTTNKIKFRFQTTIHQAFIIFNCRQASKKYIIWPLWWTMQKMTPLGAAFSQWETQIQFSRRTKKSVWSSKKMTIYQKRFIKKPYRKKVQKTK